ADRLEEHGRGNRVTAMLAQEANHAQFVLEPGDVGVEIHPVDALHFQGHMLLQDFREGLGQSHGRLRLRASALRGHPTAWRSHEPEGLPLPVWRRDRSRLHYVSTGRVPALHLVGLRRSLVRAALPSVLPSPVIAMTTLPLGTSGR